MNKDFKITPKSVGRENYDKIRSNGDYYMNRCMKISNTEFVSGITYKMLLEKNFDLIKKIEIKE